MKKKKVLKKREVKEEGMQDCVHYLGNRDCGVATVSHCASKCVYYLKNSDKKRRQGNGK